MELEELKNDWKIFEAKIEKSKEINERLIESIIRERSAGRITKMKNQYKALFFTMAIEAIFLVAVLLGNPFDFGQKWQFVPYFLLLVGVLLALFNIVKFYNQISFDFGENNISVFLKRLIGYYDKNKVYEKWFGTMLLSTGLLVPFSFLPKKIVRNGLQKALLETGIMIAITLIIYIVAFKMGAFRNRHEEKIKLDLQEYESLKSISAEL